MEPVLGVEVSAFQQEPRCVASSVSHLVDVGEESAQPPSPRSSPASENNYFKSAEWTADGTTIITNSADNHVRTFVIPPELLADREHALHLTPYSTIKSFEPVNAVVSYPGFDLQDTSTTLVLSTLRDHPIRLFSALTPQLIASYPLVNQKTEKFVTPHSLLFTADGRHFVAGSESLLAVFDISRPGQQPMLWMPTASKKRQKIAGSAMSMKGIVSALAIDNSSDVLAAGTFTRRVALYNSGGQGECVGVFCVEGNEADEHIKGAGITQLVWSRCGRYLYIAERKSNGVMYYDIRKTGELLGWLEGRNAMTNQRLGIDLVTEYETGSAVIWAGGVDGIVRIWENPHLREGPQPANSAWRGHEASVTSTIVHPFGSVVATSSGTRYSVSSERSLSNSDEEDKLSHKEEAIFDNSLKIRAL